MVNSTRRSLPPASSIALGSATTELQTLFEETRPETRPLDLLPLPMPLSMPLSKTAVGASTAAGASSHSNHTRFFQPWPDAAWRGILGIGAIVFTLTTGILTGAVVAQRYPHINVAKLNSRLHFTPIASVPEPSVPEPPLLEQVFQTLRHQQSQIQSQIQSQVQARFHQPRHSLQIAPSALDQWQPGELEAELDRLLASSQALETDLATLETQLGLDPSQLGLDPSQSGKAFSERLEALRQALVSTPVATLPLHITLSTDLLFEDGQTTLKPEATEVLQNLEESLQAALNGSLGKNLSLTIATHTDNVGPVQGNLDLSLQRSRILQAYLVQRLNPTTPSLFWNTVGYGESRPLADNSIESNRQRNRRVEINLER